MNPTEHDTTVSEEPRPRKRISYVRWTVSFLIMAPLVFVWALFLKGALLNFELISGSMEPTLMVGDRVLVMTGRIPEDLSDRVVCLRAPEDPHELLAKRVVAQGGDTVRIEDGFVYLNAARSPIDDREISDAPDRAWELDDDEIFVLGDNRGNSNDSSEWGPVARENVVGLVWLRYMPFGEFGRIW